MLYILQGLANFVGRRLGNKEIFRKHETPPFDFKETVQVCSREFLFETVMSDLQRYSPPNLYQ